MLSTVGPDYFTTLFQHDIASLARPHPTAADLSSAARVCGTTPRSKSSTRSWLLQCDVFCLFAEQADRILYVGHPSSRGQRFC